MSVELKVKEYLEKNGPIKTTMNGLNVIVQSIHMSETGVDMPGAITLVPFVTYREVKRGRPKWLSSEDFNAFVWPTGV